MATNSDAPLRERLSLGCMFAALLPMLLSLWFGVVSALMGLGLASRVSGHLALTIILCIPLPLVAWQLVRVLWRKKPLIPGIDDVTAVILVLVGMVFFAVEATNVYEITLRSHQKITLHRMKTLGIALEDIQSQNGCYPASLAGLPGELPRLDGWGRPFKFQAVNARADGRCATGYYLGSGGEDGRFSCDDLAAYPQADTGRYDADLILHDGMFLRAPAGVQRAGDEPVACGSPATRQKP